MSQYNAIGMPYSDELYHHGIQGMHWYVRRYQNADGSLTEEGRKRYSKNRRPASVTDTGTGNAKRMKKTVNEIVSKNGKQNVRKNGVPSVKGRVASGAKAVGATAARGASRLGEGIVRGVKMKLAEKFPFMLNDEEIAKYRERLQLENTYRNAMAERRSAKNRSKGDQFISNLAKDTISNTVRTATNKVVNKALDEALKTRADRELEDLDMEIKKLNADKSRFESESNKIKLGIAKDISANNEAESKIREYDKKLSDLNNTIEERNKNIEKYNKIMTDTSKSASARNAAATRYAMTSNLLDIDKKKQTTLNNQRDKLAKDVRERSTQIDYRRNQYDSFIKEQQNKTFKDIYDRLGKDNKKSAVKNFLINDLGLSEEQVDDLLDN